VSAPGSEWWGLILLTPIHLLLCAAFLLKNKLVVQGYCAKHSKKLDRDGTPRKATTSTPKKHTEMTEEEKKEAKARK